MSKKFTPWFPHETNPRSNRKLKALFNTYGGTGYGYWWILQEILCSQPEYKLDITDEFAYTELADDMRCEYDFLERFIKDCINKFHLLQCDDTHLWCPALIDVMQPLEEKRASLSERGKKGAAVTNAKKSAQATTENGTSEIKRGEKSAEKKREENRTEEKSREEVVLHNTSNTATPAATLHNAIATEQHVNNNTPLPFASLDDLKERALTDTVHFVPIHLRPGRIQTEAHLPLWLDAFNKWLRYGGEHVKSERDYRFHFNNWIQRQDMSKNPEHYNPLTDNTPQRGKYKGKQLPSAPVGISAKEALRRHKEEMERSRIIDEQLAIARGKIKPEDLAKPVD
ncbi:MAG: Lin1244/Lin1753 domain-containing protein [Flavipsychrobacter sp.]